MISICFQGKPFNIFCNPSLYPKYWCQRSWRWLVLWRLTTPSRTNTHTHTKTCPFQQRKLEGKSMKPRDIWNNSQVWPWSTKWSRAKANRVLPRELIGHSKHPLPTTQETTLCTNITRWLIPKSDWLYSLHPVLEKLYSGSKNNTGSWLGLRL